MYKPIEKIVLAGLALAVGLAGAVGCTKPTHIPNPTPTSAYELALKKLDSKTAEYWRGVSFNPNSEQAIMELALIPEEHRVVLENDISDYTTDKNISDKELSDLADPDKDGIKSSVEVGNKTNPMDPSNSTQKISPDMFSFVHNLKGYNNSVDNKKTLPETYPSLDKAIYIVENQPNIIQNLNNYGSDALVLFLNGKDNQEVLKYNEFVNASALQAQKWFYRADETKPDIKGFLMNYQFDPEEKDFLDKRWDEREFLTRDNPNIENLRHRIVNQSWFRIDGNTGVGPLSYDKDNSSTWLDVARYNQEISSKVKAEISDFINQKSDEPKEIKEGLGELVGMDLADATQGDMLIARLIRGYAQPPCWGQSGGKWGEYLDIVLEKGDESDKFLFSLIGYARTVKPAVDETYLMTLGLWGSFFGENIYLVDGTIPHTDTRDGKPAPVLSEKAMAEIQKIGNPLIDKETGAWPMVYGADKNILIKDEVKFVSLVGVDGRRDILNNN